MYTETNGFSLSLKQCISNDEMFDSCNKYYLKCSFSCILSYDEKSKLYGFFFKPGYTLKKHKIYLIKNLYEVKKLIKKALKKPINKNNYAKLFLILLNSS